MNSVPPTLLLADDEPDFTEFVKWQLAQLDYQVLTADSGEAALAILKKTPADILIADIRMPGMDGIELIRRAVALRPDIQSIVITGHGGIDTAVEAMRLGAINYLRKPVGVEEIEVAVQKGMEKLALIRQVREKQARLEAANAELLRLQEQLKAALAREKAGRKKAEAELVKARLREMTVDLLGFCLRCWKQATGKGKVELAEESKIWTASVDSGGTFRTRTLDRYLRIATLPPNPRYHDVLDTAYFLLSHTALPSALQKRLEEKIGQMEKILQHAG